MRFYDIIKGGLLIVGMFLIICVWMAREVDAQPIPPGYRALRDTVAVAVSAEGDTLYQIRCRHWGASPILLTREAADDSIAANFVGWYRHYRWRGGPRWAPIDSLQDWWHSRAVER